VLTAIIIAAALATTIDAELRAIAALPGEPSLVSAGGITRRDVAMSTLENPSPFEPVTTVRRLVLVGGFDGDEASARAVMDAVRWIKSKAPAAVRRSWIVSAMPLANPDANTAQFEFPPGNGSFDDAQVPESRYLWRWLSSAIRRPGRAVCSRWRDDNQCPRAPRGRSRWTRTVRSAVRHSAPMRCATA